MVGEIVHGQGITASSVLKGYESGRCHRFLHISVLVRINWEREIGDYPVCWPRGQHRESWFVTARVALQIGL